MNNRVKKSLAVGISGVLAMLALFFIAVGLISDMAFAISQFKKFWYYIIPLALGFGAQLALYMYLRQAVSQTDSSGKVLAVSGGTSGTAMITCCAHYIANVAPLIATAGVVTFLTQYQVQFFWVGLIFNIAGIAYIWKKIRAPRTMNKIFTVVSVIAGLIIVGWLVLRFPKISNMYNTEKSFEKNFIEQQNTEGGINITAQPFVERDTVGFKITLDTHSVDLGQDFMQIAILTDENGKTYKPTNWEGSTPGGHHRDGILKFQISSPSLKTFTLTLKNIGNVSERIFWWPIN